MVKFILACVSVIVASPLVAQETFPHPELEWNTITTDHFLVHYHNGAERTGTLAAKIAEQIYRPITQMYRHEPDQRVSIVIRDHDDYSNGSAYFYDNKIEIWAPSLDFELRGIHPWLLNVITHEFTHIVQMQTAMKLSRKIPALYLQWFGYEEERRPDVLYGFPNVLVSYPFSGFVVPSWFAEGVAQYNHPDLDFDVWDSHRDMILRMYMLEGKPLSWEEMAVFGKTSLGNESSYNAGYSIVDYIATKYGNDKLVAISNALSAPQRLTIDGAIESVLDKTGEELFGEWSRAKKEAYNQRFQETLRDRKEGTLIEREGFGNFYPSFSPDGSKLVYVSNKGQDYFGLSKVYMFDRTTKQSEELDIHTRSSLSFSPDGKVLYYAKSTRDNSHWSSYSDLYRFDLSDKKEKRITYGWRAFNPSVSSDGERLVFSTGSDGTLNVATCDSDGKHFRRLTNFRNGEQVFTPRWSPDGSTIAFGLSSGHNQSVALIDSGGNSLRRLELSGDSRNPCYSVDGKQLYFSWDEGGVYNIYSTTLATGEIVKRTTVLGGAFLPTTISTGDIAFASYKSDGYKIAILYRDSVQPNGTEHKSLAFSSSLHELESSRNDSVRDVTQSKKYRPIFSSSSLVPFLRYDNYNSSATGLDVIKPGIFFVSSEVLEKLSLFGSVAVNRRFERDLYFSVGYRDKLPLLYQVGWEPDFTVELFNVTRKIDFGFELYTPLRRQFHAEIQFNLLAFDFSLSGKVFGEHTDYRLKYSLSRYAQDFGSWFHPTFGDIPASRSVYLIANDFSVELNYDGVKRSVNQAINPIGRTIWMKVGVELNQFNPSDSAEYKNGLRVPVYSKPDLHRLEAQWTEHIPLPFQNHTISVGLKGGSILGEDVDEFFDFYAGGLFGMRGYSFYALGGNEYATLNLTYRFPLFTHLETRLLQFYFTKLYASVFVDVGDAWVGKPPAVNLFKRDVGFELRLESFSFYSYPTRFFFSGAYGLDRFSRSVNAASVTYGEEWRWYFGVLFDFEFGNIRRTIREWR
jgi:Tol biopolymer transport system component